MAGLLFTGSVIFFLFQPVFQTAIAVDTAHCPPSACGRTNISYPFRLQTDPIGCGDYKYNLSCENNVTVLHLYGGEYYVQEINYNNFTIHLVNPSVDKENCSSIPIFPLTGSSFHFKDPYCNYKTQNKNDTYTYVDLSETIGFIRCTNPVNSSVYLDASPCINSSNNSLGSRSGSYIYAYIGEMEGRDLRDNCSLEMVTLFRRRDSKNRISTFTEIHREISFGFELSWNNINCRKCRSHDCYLDSNDRVRCTKFWTWGSISFKEILFGILGVLAWICMFLAPKVLFGAPCAIAFLIYKWRRRHLSGYTTIEEFLQAQNNLMPIRYAYSDVKKMTGGFKEMLGKGGFGSVYKGKLRSGQFAAIKMLEKSKTDGQDFISEVATIGRIHHANVVQLIGFCSEGSKHALIYEFMSNGSLDSYIFCPDRSISLSWEKLYEISLGVARGIEYLHRGCNIKILHFDIKPHNILLDESFAPKLSDFGLAKFYPKRGSIASLTAARGTIGYMAPELFYKNIGRVSYKADVYSFGMLLLEMAGRRKNLKVPTEDASNNNLSQIYYPFWVYDKLVDGSVEIEDATNEEKKIVRKMIITGLWCIQMEPSNRPSMNKVVEMLEGDMESLQFPPKPLLYPIESVEKGQAESSSSSVDSTSTQQSY